MKDTHFNLTTDERGIATLLFDTPHSRANVFTQAALDELDKHLDTVAADTGLKALFIESIKEDIFIAGADINEIKAANNEEEIGALVKKGQDIFSKLESLPIPSIAIIDGACLGGGLEMSLACTYRIATSHPHTRIGLPEVNLGILPGFGGTQRLYPLLGYAKAMEIIVGAKRLKGEKALKLGLVDACVPQGYLDFKKEEFSEAILTGDLSRKLGGRRPGVRWYEKFAPIRQLIGKIAIKKIVAKTHGHYPALLAVVEVMQQSFGKTQAEGMRIEREAVTRLALTPISKNLIELFLISEELKRETFSTAAAREVKDSAVVGAGAMGSGIAWAMNNQGINVRLKDVSNESLAAAIAAIKKIYDSIRRRGRLNDREIAMKMDKITFSTDLQGFSNTDFLLEAVSEDVKVKQNVYAEFETVLPADAIIASNTSSISISLLAGKLQHPQRFVGMHFFNPVNRMPLVEIISGEQTDEETIATVVALSKKMGKTPIKVKETEGFLVNRILLPYLKEAASMFEEGEEIEKIDETLLAFGMPVGPLALVDSVGVDIGAKVSEILHAAYGERMAVCPLLDGMVASGWLGRKTGRGFYSYQHKKPVVNTEIGRLQQGTAHLESTKIEERCVFVMLNEAARCLEEKVVDNARYLDMAMVMGTGFPAFRGGLMRYADSVGLDTVVSKLNRLHGEYGERFAPCELLLAMAAKQEHFYGGNI